MYREGQGVTQDHEEALKWFRWKTQKTTSNGSPTYGRKHRGLSVSVKKATSGQWYYVTYTGTASSPPRGWFDTAQEAKETFDAQHK